MTKREKAIIMAYTGMITFTGDDIGYFLGYVKEKTGIELNVTGWSDSGVPDIDFGSTVKEVNETVDKIRKACKKDFDDLIRSCNDENEKTEEDFEDKDAEKFAKRMTVLEQLLRRDLRPDEVALLAMFGAIEVNEKKEEKLENRKPEDIHKCMHACTKQAHTQFKNDHSAGMRDLSVDDAFLTLSRLKRHQTVTLVGTSAKSSTALLESILGIDLGVKTEKRI